MEERSNSGYDSGSYDSRNLSWKDKGLSKEACANHEGMLPLPQLKTQKQHSSPCK